MGSRADFLVGLFCLLAFGALAVLWLLYALAAPDWMVILP
jgi:hypothetical protein